MSYNVVWKPLPGSQSLALSCPCDEILFEGTRGPGKTAAQLARFRRLVGLGYGTFWRGIIFDTGYVNEAGEWRINCPRIAAQKPTVISWRE